MGKVTHGLRKSKEYSHWAKMKRRCTDKFAHNYEYYGGRGIIVCEEFLNNFLEFYNEIGEIPKDGTSWTVDRIDNSKGYVKGNIQWAQIDKQCRNRRKFKTNTSGYSGVGWIVRKGNTSAYASVSVWNEAEGRYKAERKYFSVSKFGLLPAFSMAVNHRETRIMELNELGYGYTEGHGL